MTVESVASGADLVLVSHVLCPYVQRAAIVLAEKNIPFQRRDVDLSAKPDWFLAVSPLGKTPVLLAGGTAVFESAVICEYLDESHAPALHPPQALSRARHRAWMEFGSSMLNTIAAYYNAPSDSVLQGRRDELLARLSQLEPELSAQGPYFEGERFSMVDAVFAPVFRYFDAFEAAGLGPFTAHVGRVHAWRQALADRPSVRDAVSTDYPGRLMQFLRARGSALSRGMAT